MEELNSDGLLRFTLYEHLQDSFDEDNGNNIVNSINNYLKLKLKDTGVIVFKSHSDSIIEAYNESCDNGHDLFLAIRADDRSLKSQVSYVAIQYFDTKDFSTINLINKIFSRFKSEDKPEKLFKNVIVKKEDSKRKEEKILSLIISFYMGSDIVSIYNDDPDYIITNIVDKIFFSILEYFNPDSFEEIDLREYAD